MRRKMKLLKNIRRKKKKDQIVDDVLPIDFTGIQVNHAETVVGPTIEEQREQPEQEVTVDPEEARKERKNLAIQEMLANNTYLETVAFRNNEEVQSEESDDEGLFDCMMCGNLDNTCGEEIEETPSIQTKLRSYKIVKEKPREKIGLSFVAFKQQGGIFVCKIKEGSKFNATGLKVGMRVVSVNGTPCPERVGELMKMLKKVEKKLVLEVEVMDSPEKEEEIQVPQEEMKTSRKEVVRVQVETRQPAIEPAKKKVEVSKPEVIADSSPEQRLFSSDRGLDDDDSSQGSKELEEKIKIDKYKLDEPEEEDKADIYKSKFELMKKRMDLMKKKGTISFMPNRKDPYAVVKEPHTAVKDLDGEDTDETDSDTSEDKVVEELVPTTASEENGSDSSQSSGTFWTNESPYHNGMDRFTAMMDGLVGADQDRLESKKGEGFTLSEAAKKIREGAPVWMFFE